MDLITLVIVGGLITLLVIAAVFGTIRAVLRDGYGPRDVDPQKLRHLREVRERPRGSDPT